MQIQHSANVPDGTYFRTAAAEPEIQDGAIVVFNGRGSRRGWGAPQITSTVVVNQDDLVAVHIGYSHKHGGGQFWRYYTTDGQAIRQVGWADLSDDVRAVVLAGYDDHAPDWAKAPGKLRANYRRPTMTATRMYKLVEIRDDRLWSLYDPDVEYRLGRRLAERAEADHGGGYYAHPSAEQVLDLWAAGDLVPDAVYSRPLHLALIAVDMAGTVIRYPNGKVAATYCTPVEILQTMEYTPRQLAA